MSIRHGMSAIEAMILGIAPRDVRIADLEKELADVKLEREVALKRISQTQTAVRHALAIARGDVAPRLRSTKPRAKRLAPPQPRPLPDGSGL